MGQDAEEGGYGCGIGVGGGGTGGLHEGRFPTEIHCEPCYHESEGCIDPVSDLVSRVSVRCGC